MLLLEGAAVRSVVDRSARPFATAKRLAVSLTG